MTDRIRVDPVPDGFVRTFKESRAEAEHRRLGYVEILDQDVHMHLLWGARRVPVW